MTDAANGNGKEKRNPAWWEIPAEKPADIRLRAVAYYCHSAQDRQENSIPIQREQVREWAEKNDIEIIKEFADHGKSGLNAEGRPAFNEMMEEWVKKRDDFKYILCLDVSRFSRFQDIDLSAQYSAECTRNGKKVVYTTIGLPRENDSFQPVYVQFERFRAAEYSKELSVKVWRGCMKIAEQGYWAGGSPPYGLRRLLLDEKREPVHVMEGIVNVERLKSLIDAGDSDGVVKFFASANEADRKTVAAVAIECLMREARTPFLQTKPGTYTANPRLGAAERPFARRTAIWVWRLWRCTRRAF